VGRSELGDVVRLRTYRSGEEQSSADYRGICLLSPELVQQLPERGCLIGDVAIPLLERGERVATCEVQAPFWDVGSVDSYLQANLIWLAQAGRPNYVGPGAHVSEGVQLHGALVGAGALLEGSGEVRDSVIWPGARARAPLAGVVVTSTGLVVPAQDLP
jgi:mannose-1-phosphate guanylyltransferase